MKRELLNEQVDSIQAQTFWGIGGVKLKESVETPEDTTDDTEAETVTEAEVHACPLYESVLETPLSDEKLSEHVTFMMGVINEMQGEDTDDELEDTEAELEAEEV